MSEPTDLNDDGNLWHWVISLTQPASSGYAINTMEGLISGDEVRTRQEAFRVVYGIACERIGIPAGEGSVTFFCLEPNDLAREQLDRGRGKA